MVRSKQDNTLSITDITDEDRRFMRRALTLAARARTHPNPMVGAVVVKDGKIVGEGWHGGIVHEVSTPHAETMAFAAAGQSARGATLYATLEPCSFYTRSDGSPRIPCSQRCLDAGISRLVCAMVDPDTRVYGEGFAHLRAAGVEVVVGVEEARARELNRAYIRHRETGLPYLTHKAAMTLDGKIAAPGGHSRWITGEPARALVHRLREKTDMVIVGVGTVLQDDPQLTTRLPSGNGQNPARVLFDSGLRIPETARIICPGTVVLVSEAVASSAETRAKQAVLKAAGVQIVFLPPDAAGRVDVLAATRYLAAQGWLAGLVESGGALASSFWKAGLISRVMYFIAPKVIGGESAPTPIDGTGLAPTMDNAVPLERYKTRRVGNDLVIEAEVRREYVYGNH